MKTTITLSVDVEVKKLAMPIIQNKLHKTISGVLEERLREIIKEDSSEVQAYV